MKTMYPPGYHHNGFMATIALGHMMYGYTLLLPMNQRVLNKLSKERNISVYIYIYIVMMETIFPPGYHSNRFAATHVMMYVLSAVHHAQLYELPQSHCSDNQEDTWFS